MSHKLADHVNTHNNRLPNCPNCENIDYISDITTAGGQDEKIIHCATGNYCSDAREVLQLKKQKLK
jgi:hypothetical protein